MRDWALSEAYLQDWCDDGDILAPRWTDFLRDTCIRSGEVAVPVGCEQASAQEAADIRIAIMQAQGATTGGHAITFIRAGERFRRYDNDDEARHRRNTHTEVTWRAIQQEYARGAIALYAVVPTASHLATSRQAITATRHACRGSGTVRALVEHINATQGMPNRTATDSHSQSPQLLHTPADAANDLGDAADDLADFKWTYSDDELDPAAPAAEHDERQGGAAPPPRSTTSHERQVFQQLTGLDPNRAGEPDQPQDDDEHESPLYPGHQPTSPYMQFNAWQCPDTPLSESPAPSPDPIFTPVAPPSLTPSGVGEGDPAGARVSQHDPGVSPPS